VTRAAQGSKPPEGAPIYAAPRLGREGGEPVQSKDELVELLRHFNAEADACCSEQGGQMERESSLALTETHSAMSGRTLGSRK
jgi:hypothetical protein